VPDAASCGNGTALKKKDIEALRTRLLDERQRLQDMFQSDLKIGKANQEHGAEDVVDRANLDYNRELTLSLSDAERRQLIQIEDALGRIEAGEYGTCQHSGDPIPKPRLEVVPWARYCAEHQEMVEKGILEEGD
jgi:DnaK suppressor protein